MKTIAAVPESITRADYLGMIAAVGFDVKDLCNLEFRRDGIYAEVYETDAEGRRIVDKTTGESLLINRVFIPVVN